MSLEVLAPGPLCTVQDEGRAGLAAVGVGRSGAADRGAYRAANRLVGNTPGAACLEVTLGGLHVRAGADLVVAVTGAATPVRVAGRPEPHHHLLVVRAGQVLRLGAPGSGLRSYVAVRGGIAVPPVLGSRSTDTLAGLGPAPLRAGDVLPVGGAAAGWPAADFAVPPAFGDPAVLTVLPGPRADWFTPQALATLARQPWEVTAQSNRVGARLRGPAPLARAGAGELPSEGMVRGALQVPADGQPVLFLADHPVTGGYPVIAVVAEPDRAAQLRPGQRVRFALARR